MTNHEPDSVTQYLMSRPSVRHYWLSKKVARRCRGCVYFHRSHRIGFVQEIPGAGSMKRPFPKFGMRWVACKRLDLCSIVAPENPQATDPVLDPAWLIAKRAAIKLPRHQRRWRSLLREIWENYKVFIKARLAVLRAIVKTS